MTQYFYKYPAHLGLYVIVELTALYITFKYIINVATTINAHIESGGKLSTHEFFTKTSI